MKKLKVHPNRRYLMYEDGAPFYYLADTAWELIHKLNKEEMEFYLSTRKEQGFTVIQTVILAELDGILSPNASGHFPLICKEGRYGIRQEEASNFWTDLDSVLQMAGEQELYLGLLPAWGDKFNKKHGIGPEIFDEKNAYEYGKRLGERYRDQWNIIWILGGDRPLETKEQEGIIDAMAKGLREGDAGTHLMTFHPCGAASSADFVAGKDYIDFHSIQSGHGMEGYESYYMLRNTARREAKPVMDMESRYEDFPACFRTDYGYLWSAADVRQNNYWNLMEGVCGHTYGHRAVWCFHTETTVDNPYSWREVLRREGAEQIRHLKKLRLSRSYFDFRNGDELIRGRTGGGGHQCAGRGENYAYLYSPLGLPVYTELSSFGGSNLRASWFNPRTGSEEVFAFVTSREEVFVPPSSGKGNDWVLILEKAE